MTIDEMHISVLQGVDKLNAMQADLILPEEIDLELNKNIERFISQRFGARSNRFQEGFEMSQKRIDDLRSLVVEASEIAYYKGEVFKDTFVETIPFPNDYLHLINVKSLVELQKCKKFCSTTDTVFKTNTTFVLDLTACTMGAWDVFSVYITPSNTGQLAGQKQILAPSATGTTSSQSAVMSHILNPSNWTNGATFTAINNATALITLPLQYSSYLGGYYKYTAGTVVTCTAGIGNRVPGITGEKRIGCGDVDTTTLVGMNKFAQHDDIFALLSDPFNKTTYKSPLYTIREEGIDIYTDETFIVTNGKLTYLRTPAVVSNISTLVHCDLPDHTHQEIVQMTVNSILEELSDPRYQSSNMEILKSE